MQSKAATVKQYLSELPKDRRAAIETVRKAIVANLDKGYEEGMQYGMIGWYVPHRIYPAGYHCDPKQPLPFAGLASQKNYMSLYIMTTYGEGSDEQWFRKEWAKTGKKLDMGKCCIRFKKIEDLALGVIGEAIRRMPVKTHIERYEAAMSFNPRPKGKPAPARRASSPAKAAAKPRKPTRRKKVKA
jgi:hypothetical protein